jgi:hypothetical protein
MRWGDRMMGIQTTLFSNTKPQWRFETTAKLDTGASRSSVDEKLASALRLPKISEKKFKNAMGSQKRDIVELILQIDGQLISVEASITDRSGLKAPVLLGQDIIGLIS